MTFGEETLLAGLEIIAEDDTGNCVEEKSIFKDYIERRQALERKNYSFNNLHLCFSTNSID